jgi:hypothetical protein
MATVITKPKVTIDPKILHEIQSKTQEMGQVVLHFLLQNNSAHPSGIRIWPSTYLYDLNSSHVSELVHAENITLYPTWQSIGPFTKTYFSLYFSGLPRSCSAFQFEECCTNQAGAWSVKRIDRNNSDVYFLQIS